MNPADVLSRLGILIHRNLLPLVALAYALAAIDPAPGLWTKNCVVTSVCGVTVTLPMVFLAVLLFNAGMGASVGELGSVLRRPTAILAGVLLNVMTPLAFLFVLKHMLVGWHDAKEADCLLLGLAVVAAMPVAGSSTAWSQTAGGNLALSLGLVLVSTSLSPLTTPLVLAGVGEVTPGGTAMSDPVACDMLWIVVVAPSALGLLARRVLGTRLTTLLKPTQKLINVLVLLYLCYSNATVALPQVVADPDWDFLALVGVAVSMQCGTAFASGWFLAKGLRADKADSRALTFGLGMSNNGTGLVLAASSLGSLPFALVPVLAYNLVQHIVAGGVSRILANREQRE